MAMTVPYSACIQRKTENKFVLNTVLLVCWVRVWVYRLGQCLWQLLAEQLAGDHFCNFLHQPLLHLLLPAQPQPLVSAQPSWPEQNHRAQALISHLYTSLCFSFSQGWPLCAKPCHYLMLLQNLSFLCLKHILFLIYVNCSKSHNS